MMSSDHPSDMALHRVRSIKRAGEAPAVSSKRAREQHERHAALLYRYEMGAIFSAMVVVLLLVGAMLYAN